MIRDVVLLQKRELENRLKENYIEREAKDITPGLINVISGPRRAGKSFFAIHRLNKLGRFGYVNFDDEKLAGAEDYNEIIDTANHVYDNPKFFLFDEIQNLESWELFVNRLHRQGYRLIITGSNSKLLSRELATHLTGRHTTINIFPFSFREFLDNKELTKSEIKIKLASYLTHGGFPEPLIKKLDYNDYLSTLFDSVIYKDIVKRYKIRSVQAIEDLATYLISNIANEISYNTISKVTRCKSIHTVEKYLNYLEEAFVFFKLSRFSFKAKERLTFNKKIYTIDNGFIYSKASKFSLDAGKLYENVVATELRKIGANGKANVYFWKNPQQEEVDFVVKEGLKVTKLIQVCYDISATKTREREVRALLKASKELKCNNLILITDDYESEEDISWFGIKRKVKFIPLWKWLLADK